MKGSLRPSSHSWKTEASDDMRCEKVRHLQALARGMQYLRSVILLEPLRSYGPYSASPQTALHTKRRNGQSCSSEEYPAVMYGGEQGTMPCTTPSSLCSSSTPLPFGSSTAWGTDSGAREHFKEHSLHTYLGVNVQPSSLPGFARASKRASSKTLCLKPYGRLWR